MSREAIFKALAAALLGLAVAACTGGDDTLRPNDNGDGVGGTDSGTGDDPTVVQTVDVVEMRTDRTSIGSTSDEATITATVKDANNRVIEGANVAFSSDSGTLAVQQGVTDAAGRAIASLSAGSDRSGRVITVTASADATAESIQVTINGPQISISGPNSVTAGGTADFVLQVTDSQGNAIAGATVSVSSSAGNTLGANSLTTDGNGLATVTLTATAAATTDTLTVSALGGSATRQISVVQDSFQLTSPPSGTEVPLGQDQAVTLTWTSSGAPQAGQQISFSTSKGTVNGQASTTVTTDANGQATVTARASSAGRATIVAQTSATDGPQAATDLEFVAVGVASLQLNADPLQLSPEASSNLVATLRDASGNPVKNATVSFTIEQDPSGGTLSVVTAQTDSQGTARTVYTAGGTTTTLDGVRISAQFIEEEDIPNALPTLVPDSVQLTIAGRALRVTLGTGNEIEEPNLTQYRMPWAVQVTDANGNAIVDQVVQIRVIPLIFRKGTYAFPEGGNRWVLQVAQQCLNEDNGRVASEQVLRNPPPDQLPALIDDMLAASNLEALDGGEQPGEELNGDEQLTPGNPVAAPNTVTTGDDGTAEFRLVYPQQFANWIRVQLAVSIPLGSSGTEATESTRFDLPIIVSDINNENVNPPGNPSPFGQAPGCDNTD